VSGQQPRQQRLDALVTKRSNKIAHFHILGLTTGLVHNREIATAVYSQSAVASALRAQPEPARVRAHTRMVARKRSRHTTLIAIIELWSQ
jgi:hypothetical protein